MMLMLSNHNAQLRSELPHVFLVRWNLKSGDYRLSFHPSQRINATTLGSNWIFYWGEGKGYDYLGHLR